MVDVLGHLAAGLLCTVPAWVYWREEVAFTFVAVVLGAVIVPDIDLYLPWVRHHGPTHTVLFATIVAIVGGTVFARVAPRLLRVELRDDLRRAVPLGLFGFAASALLVGGAGHVVVDSLSTSTAGQPVRPLWPLVERSSSVHVLRRFSAPLWNGIPFALGLSLHVGVLLPSVPRSMLLDV